MTWTTKSGEARVKVTDAKEGIVTAIVASTEIEDAQGDIIAAGAFEESLSRRVPVGLAGHDWQKRVARTIDAKEIMPGDRRLPQRWKDAGAGAVQIVGQYHVTPEDDEARREFARVQFFGPQQEWSVGLFVLKDKIDSEQDARRIEAIDWVEWSSVVAGANPLTGLLDVKEARKRQQVVKRLEELAERVGEEKALEVVERVLAIIRTAGAEAAQEVCDLMERRQLRPYVEALLSVIALPPREPKRCEAIKPHDTPVTDRGDWDGPEMVRRCPSEEAALVKLHAWRDPEGNPDAKSSYKLPHHFVDTDGTVGPAHIRGVRAALAVLAGARGGVNIPDSDRGAVAEHLQRHVEAWERMTLSRAERKNRMLQRLQGLC